MSKIPEEIMPIIHELHERSIISNRMSPWAKEQLFQLWCKGYDIKDLSLRYGITCVRVIAIIWQKRLFYEEIYPRAPKTLIRLAIDVENLYGTQ